MPTLCDAFFVSDYKKRAPDDARFSPALFSGSAPFIPTVEVLDTRKVKPAITLRGVQSEQVTRLGSHRNRGLAIQCQFPGQAQVLSHQVSQEPSLIVTGGSRTLHDSGPGVIDIERPVAATALFHDLRKNCRVEAVFDPKCQRLAGTAHEDT